MEKDDKKEILEAINGLETRVESKLTEAINGLETRVESKIQDVIDVIGDFSTKVDERFSRIESDIVSIKSQMVTKEYLDDKLINLKADLTVVMRKEDHKLEALTKLLAAKKVITEDDARGILSLEPFPQMV